MKSLSSIIRRVLVRTSRAINVTLDDVRQLTRQLALGSVNDTRRRNLANGKDATVDPL